MNDCLMQKNIGKSDPDRDNPSSFRKAYCYSMHDALELMFRSADILDGSIFKSQLQTLNALITSLSIQLEK